MKAKEFGKEILRKYEKYNEFWYKSNKETRRSGPASGQYSEEVVKYFIKKHLKDTEGIRLVSGMIYRDGKLTPQVDIIICSPNEKDAIFNKEYGIVDSSNVYGVLEVKTSSDGINQIEAIRTCLGLEESQRIKWGILKILCSKPRKLQQNQNIGDSTDIETFFISTRLDTRKKENKSRIGKDDNIIQLKSDNGYAWWEIDAVSINKFLAWLDGLAVYHKKGSSGKIKE